MARAVFDGCHYTLPRESPETRREFEQNNQGRVTAGWEMVVPPPGPDGGSNFASEGGPAQVNHTSVPFLAARLYVPAPNDKSSGLCHGLRSDVMVWV